MKKRSKVKIIICFILIIIIVVAFTYIIRIFLLGQEAIEESRLLNEIILTDAELNEIRAQEEEQEKENIIRKEEEAKKEKEQEKKERMLKVGKLQEINSDIVGWIEIEGTNINYPVLQGKDNNYYLDHNYKKQKTEKGSIFLDKSYDWDIKSNNLIIYGHNLVNGQMFKDLLKYAKEDFYKKHKAIRFTTEKEDKEYEIISAFKSKVYNQKEKNAFRYYDFINSKSEKEYNNFVKQAKEASLYDTKNTAKYGDELITLITCAYHVDDGRFVVIAGETD